MPDQLPDADRAWQVEPADWERHVFVYCTAFQKQQLLDRFFAIADHGSAACREIRLCLVLNSEFQRYSQYRPDFAARRCPALRERGVRFVYGDARPATPASLDNVSIELDEYTRRDEKSCILRKNGGTHRRYYGEVRCEFGAVLEAALAVWSRPATMRILQNEAALCGGVLPRGGRSRRAFGGRGSRTLPTHLLMRRMPLTWCRYRKEIDWNIGLPCAVFCTSNIPEEVLDEFLDSVNFPSLSPFHRTRVKLIATTDPPSPEYTLLASSPVPTLTHPFLQLSPAALAKFVQHKCTHTALSTTQFLILDALTPSTSTCLICSLNPSFTPAYHLVRCAFSACADLLGDIAINNCIHEYASEAALTRDGYIPPNDDVLEDTLAGDASLATQTMNEPIRSKTLTPSMSQALFHTDTSTTTSPSPTTTTTTTTNTSTPGTSPTPAKKTPTLAPVRSKTGSKGEANYTPSPEFSYFKLTQRVAIGVTPNRHSHTHGHTPTPRQKHRRRTEEPWPETWKPPRRYGTPKRQGSRDSGLGESVTSRRYFDVGGDERGEGGGSGDWEAVDEVESFDECVGGGVESPLTQAEGLAWSPTPDGWFDIRLPEVTGSTQMSCD